MAGGRIELFAFLLVGGVAVGAAQMPQVNEWLDRNKVALNAFLNPDAVGDVASSDAVETAQEQLEEAQLATPDAPEDGVAERSNTDAADKTAEAIAKGQIEAVKPQDEPSAAKTAAEAPTSQDSEADAPEVLAGVSEPQPEEAQKTVSAFNVEGPRIDLLRVEPDGNTLIAGSGPVGSSIELMDGDTLLGEAKVGPSGDFVLMLDKFLPKGDYELQLAARLPDSTAKVLSDQSAIISIPEPGREDELMAIVTSPDGPSQIITKPTVETAELETAEMTVKEVQTDTLPTVPTDTAGDQMQTAELAENKAEDPQALVAENAATTPEEQSLSSASDLASAASQAAQKLDDDTSRDEANVQIAALPEAKTPVEAAATSKNLSKSTPDTPTAMALVEAVEVEPGRFFIAGSGTAGAKMRIYLDNELIGRAQVGEGDRFLFERAMDIEPGEHKVRIDVLSKDGSFVVSRAEVPFTREESANVVASLVQPKAQAAVAAPDQPEPGPDRMKTFVPSDTSTAEQKIENTDLESARAKPDLEQQEMAKHSSGESISEDIADATGTTDTPAIVEEKTVAAAGDAVPTVTYEVTDEKERSVIIRRGDTLWQISRRVYGRGIRYTTIYLANQDQIRNPDLIYPGQLFDVPEGGTDDDATAAN